jgi:hypothetical protein
VPQTPPGCEEALERKGYNPHIHRHTYACQGDMWGAQVHGTCPAFFLEHSAHPPCGTWCMVQDTHACMRTQAHILAPVRCCSLQVCSRNPREGSLAQREESGSWNFSPPPQHSEKVLQRVTHLTSSVPRCGQATSFPSCVANSSRFTPPQNPALNFISFHPHSP